MNALAVNPKLDSKLFKDLLLLESALSGLGYKQRSTPHLNSGRDCQFDVSGCSALYGPHHIHQHDMVCPPAGGACPLLSLAGRITEQIYYVMQVHDHPTNQQQLCAEVVSHE